MTVEQSEGKKQFESKIIRSSYCCQLEKIFSCFIFDTNLLQQRNHHPWWKAPLWRPFQAAGRTLTPRVARCSWNQSCQDQNDDFVDGDQNVFKVKMVIVMMVRLNTMIAFMMMMVILLMLFLMMIVTDLATGSMLRSSGSILTMRPDMRPV